jgi:hypothetical protein
VTEQYARLAEHHVPRKEISASEAAGSQLLPDQQIRSAISSLIHVDASMSAERSVEWKPLSIRVDSVDHEIVYDDVRAYRLRVETFSVWATGRTGFNHQRWSSRITTAFWWWTLA